MASRGAYISWQQSPERMAADLEAWWARVERRIPGELERAGAQVVAFARASHPWRNRTGAAEAGLSYEVRREGDTFVLDIKHGVYYGVYLEGRWGGRWGVLPAAINMGGPLVLAAALASFGG